MTDTVIETAHLAEPSATPEPALTGTEQHRDGAIFRTVVVSDPGDGRVTVYLTAFTT